NSEESASLLNDAIDRFPRLAVFKNNLAVLYENIDKAGEAEKLYRQALETTPRDELICRNLADFYYEAQILGAAKELYEKISIDKRDWQILFRLGNIHLRQGDQDKALHLWVQARDLNPSERTVTQNIELLQKSDGK
ncbi:tetratricopeptide repeat protein, partial [candidate division WOR-3 bacterium]|nr:tetratricopeptide repeat protein [candidate division WOR-3 bacterium]